MCREVKGLIAIVQESIDVSAVLRVVSSNSSGATALFLGTVRDHGDKGPVSEMYYEAYPEMAEEALRKIEHQTTQRWNLLGFMAVHRLGNLKVGEISVAIAASSEHRKEAFEACRYAIDAIKRSVPIWKKEISATGSRWVEGVMLEDNQDGHV
ncbi:MAG: molybdenum cofactor biosynthesis protein MoaE [Nitrososphaerota archaeon]|uniref:molybdenum cofactor biosynthesis protein MoaE n=1 Tax=Candidatus Bathycorpusculum sp. TaxID=2994959 RepID=UPI00282E5CE1|nr:molybdenum cofactor biosynthesis protein MoaE [Candidatus Termitimicrobium sp.]MCL2431527.1 molybdenum cofactor biosynthesis protein MoaE [Candidatus Termitimicrobium sp.]MDR0493587.1 molybdenum cofactor biosynthesis protein MoaE [Nitrososphaerota archaeon]